jgi:hypothetical protein
MALVLATLVYSGCVKVETGPPTADQELRASRYRGKDIRVEWSQRFQSAPGPEKGFILKFLVDSVGARYLEYGRTVTSDWRAMSAAQGGEVPAAQMREAIKNANDEQAPVFKAWEDVIEFGLQEMTREALYAPGTMDLLTEFADQFYNVYSTVFFPVDRVELYEDDLAVVRSELERLSYQVEQELARYR